MRCFEEKMLHLSTYLIVVILVFGTGQAIAAEIKVAVASSFANTMKVIAQQFEDNTGIQVLLSSGSTGKHYAQIINGAPFDAFFAADIRRPERLEQDGYTLTASRFTYARGKLVLWSPQAGYVDPQGEVLAKGDYRHLSIANPKLAPYGLAAREVLQKLGLWDELVGRLVRGENVGQAFQFVKSGNAEIGLVAWTQLLEADHNVSGSYWHVPRSLYTAIDQQAVILKDHQAVHDFVSFVRSDDGARIIREHGYETP